MKQLLVMPVGFSRSGKTTLCQRIEERFPEVFVRVDSDSLRDYLDKQFPQLRGARVGDGTFSLRNEAAKAMHYSIARVLLGNGRSVILDACNQVRATRHEIIATAQRTVPDIVTVIIDIVIPEEQLLRTLRSEDAKRTKRSGKHATWVDLYESVQKKRLERPDASEADCVLSFDRTNEDEIMEHLIALRRTGLRS